MRYSLRRTVMVLLFLALTILCGKVPACLYHSYCGKVCVSSILPEPLIPPDMSYGRIVLAPLWATVQMSLAGTGIGAVLGLVGGSFASAISILMPGCVFRSSSHPSHPYYPALILALLCTFLVGLGTLAGTLALSIYTTAVMARMGYEDMENADQKAAKALEAAGCGRLRASFALSSGGAGRISD